MDKADIIALHFAIAVIRAFQPRFLEKRFTWKRTFFALKMTRGPLLESFQNLTGNSHPVDLPVIPKNAERNHEASF